MKLRRSAAPPNPEDTQPTHVVAGRYRLSGKIGSGGMADVYEGVDIRLRRPVAVKVFRPGSEPQTEESLTAEAVLLAGLQHPGLVTVYDAGRYHDRTYLVMQLVDGPTLRGLLARGALPQRQVADLGIGLARALAHVHRAGIVHRDVKPSNILLDAAGTPHLADFGIARLVDATRHTAPDTLTGTAAYLAPEQIEGRHVGPAADVYALGLVLLECLKGELEYPGAPLEAAIARLHRAPMVPTWLCPDLVTLLQAMTTQDPTARPDAEQCAHALFSLNSGSSPYPPPLSSSSVARPPAPGTVRPCAEEPTRRRAVAVPRSRPPGGARPHRRMTVGAALAALSVALGTTVAVAPGAGGSSDDRAHTQTAAHPPSSTASPRSRRSVGPPAETQRDRLSSRTVGASRPGTGSETEPVAMKLGSSDLAASTRRAPAPHHGVETRKRAPHHPRGKGDHPHPMPHSAPELPGKTDKHPGRPTRKNRG